MWLTTETSHHFPISLLQNGIKITKEAPQGLKENLLRTYKSEPMINPKFYSGCPAKYREFTKLLYGFAFFHAVIQVRKQFGAFGWNRDYDFDESDFFISVSQLQRFINKTGVIEFKGIAILTTECNYGGKIDSDWEREKLMTILEDYFNEGVILDSTFEFYPTEKHTYGIPRKFEYRDMLMHIEKEIPSVPSPWIYDIHPNAQIRSGIVLGKALVDDLVLTLGRVEDPVTDEKEQQLHVHVEELKGYLEPPIDLVVVKTKFPNDYRQCLNMNLLHEVIAYNVLVERIGKTLGQLQSAIEGRMVYTSELKTMAYEISNCTVPRDWRLLSYPTMKPIGSYFEDLRKKMRWMKDWVENGIPSSFWMAAFFYPQAFLVSCKQNYSRQYDLPLSNIHFKYLVSGPDELAAVGGSNSIFVWGLILEGVRWDTERNMLVEPRDKEIAEQLPGVHFILTEDRPAGKGKFECPVFKTESRSEDFEICNTFSPTFVTTIELNTELDPIVWIKRGVAIVLQSSQ